MHTGAWAALRARRAVCSTTSLTDERLTPARQHAAATAAAVGGSGRRRAGEGAGAPPRRAELLGRDGKRAGRSGPVLLLLKNSARCPSLRAPGRDGSHPRSPVLAAMNDTRRPGEETGARGKHAAEPGGERRRQAPPGRAPGHQGPRWPLLSTTGQARAKASQDPRDKDCRPPLTAGETEVQTTKSVSEESLGADPGPGLRSCTAHSQSPLGCPPAWPERQVGGRGGQGGRRPARDGESQKASPGKLRAPATAWTARAGRTGRHGPSDGAGGPRPIRGPGLPAGGRGAGLHLLGFAHCAYLTRQKTLAFLALGGGPWEFVLSALSCVDHTEPRPKFVQHRLPGRGSVAGAAAGAAARALNQRFPGARAPRGGEGAGSSGVCRAASSRSLNKSGHRRRRHRFANTRRTNGDGRGRADPSIGASPALTFGNVCGSKAAPRTRTRRAGVKYG